jgi:hypothetical protein
LQIPQQHVRFIFRERRVLDALRHHKNLACLHAHITIAQPHDHLALQDEEEVVGVRMRVPGKLSLKFHHHQVVPIERANDTRLPMVFEQRELVGEIYLVHA